MNKSYQTIPNGFKERVLSSETLIGCWASLAHDMTTEILGVVGFDWILIDCEHAPNDLQTCRYQLNALKGSRSAPVVRPSANDPVELKRLLDLGFMNVLIPQVESVEEAVRAVAATRYPPYGVRGVSLSQRCNKYGTQSDYLQQVNEQVCVLVQIETRKGIENLDEILQVNGVNGIFIGPADLSASLGYFGAPSHPLVQENMQRIYSQSVSKGKAVGTLATNEEDAERYIKEGYHFVAIGTDQGLFRKAAEQVYSRFVCTK